MAPKLTQSGQDMLRDPAATGVPTVIGLPAGNPRASDVSWIVTTLRTILALPFESLLNPGDLTILRQLAMEFFKRLYPQYFGADGTIKPTTVATWAFELMPTWLKVILGLGSAALISVILYLLGLFDSDKPGRR